MIRLLAATRLLLPHRASVIGYWLGSGILLLLIALGMKATSETSATLWGWTLMSGSAGFGTDADEVIQNAFREMMNHVWTLLLLPFACLGASRSVLDSLQSDFEQLLRYSRSTRVFIEAARWLALLAIAAVLVAPFLAAVLLGCHRPGLELDRLGDAVAGCGVCTIFLLGLLYLLATARLPREMVMGLGIMTPFLLAGCSWFVGRGGFGIPEWLLIPGLPYSVQSCSDAGARSAVVFTVLVAMARLISVAWTRWLDND